MLNALERRGPGDLYPEDLREEIDALNERIYDDVNNGVYRAGFATSQRGVRGGVHRAVRAPRRARGAARRAALPRRRPDHRGRLAAVGHARCASTPSTTCTSAATAGASSTTRTCGRTRASSTSGRASPRPSAWDEIKRHYYTTHDELNPKRIIPAGPLGMDWDAPHGRG